MKMPSRRGESGASLLIVVAIVGFSALLIGSLAGLADATLRSHHAYSAHLDRVYAADAMLTATVEELARGASCTADVGGPATTTTTPDAPPTTAEGATTTDETTSTALEETTTTTIAMLFNNIQIDVGRAFSGSICTLTAVEHNTHQTVIVATVDLSAPVAIKTWHVLVGGV